jgi:hypothetical protein
MVVEVGDGEEVLTDTADDEWYEVPGPFSGQLKDVKNRCDAKKSNKYDCCYLAWVVMVEKKLCSWNEPLYQRQHDGLDNTREL